MNGRLIVTLALLLALILLGSVAVFSVVNPNVQTVLATRTRVAQITRAAEQAATETAVARATSTQLAIEATQTAMPTSTATATPTLTPTSTYTPTPTMTPVPTSTPTPPPPTVTCPALVVGSERYVYSAPGGALVNTAELLPAATAVDVIGHIRDRGWVLVSHSGGVDGWVRSDFVEQVDPNCVPSEYSLAYLLGRDESSGTKTLLDETFASNENGWSSNDVDIFSIRKNYGEMVLPVTATDPVVVRSRNVELVEQSGAFDTILVFDRENLTFDGSVGFRFRVTDNHQWQVTVLSDCTVQVSADGETVNERLITPETNICRDDIPDQLEIKLDDNYLLRVILNGSEPFDTQLSDPSGIYSSGAIELEVGNANVDFYFMIVSQPQ